MSEETADKINRTRNNGGRIIAVGTTSCRTLESMNLDNGLVKPGGGYTDILFIPAMNLSFLTDL